MERNDMDVIGFARKTSMLTTDTPLHLFIISLKIVIFVQYTLQ